MTDFYISLLDKYEKGSLDLTAVTPYDLLMLQAQLAKMKRDEDVQKIASIARNRKSFTGKLDLETSDATASAVS